MKSLRSDVVVIGAGASGLMAAITAAELGARVVILEKNQAPGVKLRITGKGRCNVTNDCDAQTVLSNVTGGARFLNSAVRSFPPAEVMRFFEGLGVQLKTERGNRVFPVSDRAADIANALADYAAQLGVERIKCRATDVMFEDGAVKGVRVSELRTDGQGAADSQSGFFECACVIVCTGGLSYPKTGSTGDGYRFAKRAGHTVTPVGASLVPLESPDGFCAAMQGLSLKNVRLTLTGEKSGRLFEEQGEAQFTHFGITGPLVLSASAHMRDPTDSYSVSFDLKPALDEKTLDERILRDFDKYKNKEFRNALDDLAPRLLIPVLVERSGIAPDTRVNSVTRDMRRGLTALFKSFTVNISGKRPVDEAVITSGGVKLEEVNPSTMESKLVKGLYFAGEVLDLDAYTGGFNLQIAWSTGRLAGAKAAAGVNK